MNIQKDNRLLMQKILGVLAVILIATGFVCFLLAGFHVIRPEGIIAHAMAATWTVGIVLLVTALILPGRNKSH